MKKLFLIFCLTLAAIVNLNAEQFGRIDVKKLSVKQQSTTPAVNPSSGFFFIYPKTDGFWYGLNSSGTETRLTPYITSVFGRTGAVTAQAGDYTAADVGLGNVTNESKATMFADPTFTGTVVIPTPFTLGAISVTATGTEINYLAGVTSALQTQLDGKVPDTRTINGNALSGDITLDADDLGDGATNAIITLTQEANFETAYTHSQATTGNPHSVTASDVGLGNVDNTSDATKNSAAVTLTNKTLTSPVINVSSDAEGDIYYRDSSGNFTRLGIGASGKVLKSNGTIPGWDDESGASPLTTKGDLYAYGSADARLPVGTNGQILSVDSTETTGMKWISAPGGGDMLSGTYDPAAIGEQLVGLTATQTLTNKTLTAPIISTISNTGTLTLPTSTDTLVGRDTTDTLTNKTLTSPVINVSSDAEGDIYYRDSSGNFTRLGIGSNGQVLKSNGTIPGWDTDTGGTQILTSISGDNFIYPKTGITNPFTNAANSANITFDVDNYADAAALLSTSSNEPMQLPKFKIPTACTSLKFRLVYEPETGNSWSSETVIWKLQYKDMTDNNTWSAVTSKDIGTDTVPASGSNPQLYEATVSLATLGLAVGDVVQMVVFVDSTSTWANDIAFELCEIEVVQ